MSDNDKLCPLKHLANTFGGKWKLPIICILSCDDYSAKRYSVSRKYHKFNACSIFEGA